MSLAPFSFTTGKCTLPDVGQLSYNGCTFSPLYETTLSGNFVKTNDGRTTKWLELLLTADGYVTLATGTSLTTDSGLSISSSMMTLATLLGAQGGTLNYRGRGFDLIVNAAGATFTGPGGQSITTADLAWGPDPKIIEFQPLGGGLSAKIRWQVTVHVPVLARRATSVVNLLLQFVTSTSVTYDDAGFSTLTVRGTMEIPNTRIPSQVTRTSTFTVDQVRRQIDSRVFANIDLARFRITKREFNVSSDNRTMDWDFVAEEKPYMDLPSGATVARGSYSVRPSKAGMGLVNWFCTLRATYTIRADAPRRAAWDSFLTLLRLRMMYSAKASVLGIGGAAANQAPFIARVIAGIPQAALRGAFQVFGINIGDPLQFHAENLQNQNRAVQDSRNAFLVDFSIDEGVYLDSKTTTFTASWKLITEFSHIIAASGIWRKVPELTDDNKNLWAVSMRDIEGTRSWLPNELDPTLDLIVDFGA